LHSANPALATTLFEPRIAHQPATATMLQIQYRMHDEIIAFSSAFFHDGKLIPHESVRYATLGPGIPPVEFIDTAGSGYTEEQDPETLSRYNVEEAALVVRYVDQLVQATNLVENPRTIGIITPYRAQVERLTAGIESMEWYEPLKGGITIDTVDAFQGQERDIIVLSFVRSNDRAEVGFLADIRRT